MTENTYPLRYSPSLARRVIMSYVMRTLGWPYFLAVAALAFGFLYSVGDGDRSWFVGVLGAVVGLATLIPLIGFTVRYRQSAVMIREMKNPEAILSVDATGLTVSSGLGTSTFPWSSITEIWRYSDYWLVLFSKSQFITLPLASIPLDIQGRIASSVENAGGKITG
ncbi:MAG: YcxB family protein [Planctomycetia bacterium]|nr:YcxB family protein [Planctomycetia bacterium]